MTFDQSVEFGVQARAIKIEQSVERCCLLIRIRGHLRREGPSSTGDIVRAMVDKTRHYYKAQAVLERHCRRLEKVRDHRTGHENWMWEIKPDETILSHEGKAE